MNRYNLNEGISSDPVRRRITSLIKGNTLGNSPHVIKRKIKAALADKGIDASNIDEIDDETILDVAYEVIDPTKIVQRGRKEEDAPLIFQARKKTSSSGGNLRGPAKFNSIKQKYSSNIFTYIDKVKNPFDNSDVYKYQAVDNRILVFFMAKHFLGNTADLSDIEEDDITQITVVNRRENAIIDDYFSGDNDWSNDDEENDDEDDDFDDEDEEMTFHGTNADDVAYAYAHQGYYKNRKAIQRRPKWKSSW